MNKNKIHMMFITLMIFLSLFASIICTIPTVSAGTTTVGFTEYNGQNGKVNRNGQDSGWATCIDHTTAISITTDEGSTYNSKSGVYFICQREMLFYDTSSIPDDVTITGVSIYHPTLSGAYTSGYIYVQKANTGNTLDTGDYNRALYSDLYSNYNWAGTTASFNLTFNQNISTSINKTGITRFVIRFTKDYNRVVPAEDNGFTCANEHLIKLWVTYTTPDIFPNLSDEKPVNNSVDIMLNPKLNITVSNDGGLPMNVYFRTNASGVWTTVGSNLSVYNGTYRQTTTTMNKYNYKYWWAVNCSLISGSTYWTNKTYSFTTKILDTKVNDISPYHQTSSPLTITATGDDILDNVTLYYYYSSVNATILKKYLTGFPRKDIIRHGIESSYYDYPNSANILNGICYSITLYSSSINVFDCTDSSNIYEIAYFSNSSLTGCHDGYVTPDGRFMYTLTWSSPRLSMWDVSNPYSITMVNHTDTGLDTNGYYVSNHGNYLFVTTNAHVRIYNITNRNTTYQMDLITSFADADIPVGCEYWYTKVFYDSNFSYLYIMPGDSSINEGGLLIYNITDINSPTKITYLNKTTAMFLYPPIVENINGFDYMFGSSKKLHTPDSWYWSHIYVWNISASSYENPLLMYRLRTTPNETTGSKGNTTSNPICMVNGYAILMAWNSNISNYGGGIAIYNFTDINIPTFYNKIGGKGTPSYLNLAHFINKDNNNSDRSIYIVVQNDDCFNVYDPVWVIKDAPLPGTFIEYETDDSYPWSFSFDFPNGTGYYYFYSIGKKTGSTVELIPSTSDAYCHYQEYINEQPIASNPIPLNGSFNIQFNPALSITVNDGNGDAMNVYFRTNASGVWDTIGNNLSVYNGTYRQHTTGFDSYNTLYYWSINITDGTTWKNYSYYFTTKHNVAPLISSPYPSNNSVGVSISLTQIRITISDLETFNYTIELSNGQSTSGYNNTNGTKILNLIGALNYETKYTWFVNASDGINESTAMFYFTTKSNISGVIGGNVTISFDLNQFGLMILMILSFFFLVIGIIARDKTLCGLILLIDGILFFYLSGMLLVVFGAGWVVIAPAFAIIGILISLYGVLTMKK